MKIIKKEPIFKEQISTLLGGELCGINAIGLNLEMGRKLIHINEQQILLRLKRDRFLEEILIYFWEDEDTYGRSFYYFDIEMRHQQPKFNSVQEQFNAIHKDSFKSSINFPKKFVIENISIFGEYKEVFISDEWLLNHYFEKKIINSPIPFSYLIDTINAIVFKCGDIYVLISAFRGAVILYGTKEEIENELYYLDENDEKKKLKHYFDL